MTFSNHPNAAQSNSSPQNDNEMSSVLLGMKMMLILKSKKENPEKRRYAVVKTKRSGSEIKGSVDRKLRKAVHGQRTV